MTTTIAPAAPAYDLVGVLRESLMDAATGALPYIGIGVAAGVIVMAVVWGVTAAGKAMRTAADGGSGRGSGYVESGGRLYFNGQDLGDPYVEGGDGDEWVDRSVHK